MKKIIFGAILLFSTTVFAEEIVVYGPESSKWIGKKYGPIFEKKTGDTIKYVAMDGIIQRSRLERQKPKSDIAVGLSPIDVQLGKKYKLFLTYEPENIGKLKKEIVFDKENNATPYDYGMLAINYDKSKIKNPPKTLAELAKMKKQLLIQNPKTSVTGSETLQWSIALYGKDWKKFWTTIKPAVYNVEAGWEESFAKFLTGEAPMMIGYATSDIFFSQDKTQKDKYASFFLEDGNYVVVESAALVARKEVKPGAKKFMEELLSDEFQKMASEENYMFPVTSVPLGKDFEVVPTTDKKVQFTPKQEEIDKVNQYKSEVIEILKK